MATVERARDVAIDRARHWDGLYETRAGSGPSWFQRDPVTSLELITLLATELSAPVIDVGGGSCCLAERLVERGFSDVTVVDVSERALEAGRHRVGADPRVRWLRADILSWTPDRRFDLWHDRAVFHFLTGPEERAAYLAVLSAALFPGGNLVIGTFAEDGPTHCSGLPVARYSPQELGEVLGPDFQAFEFRRELHMTPDGVGQPFTWLAGTFGSATHGAGTGRVDSESGG